MCHQTSEQEKKDNILWKNAKESKKRGIVKNIDTYYIL